VLLVEDNDDHRDSLAAFVSSMGLDAVGARSGAEALSQLRQEPGRWCLVVLDWWLPDMTGEHFRRRQRLDPRIADVAVVAVTGDGRVRETAARVGFAHFLVKPVEPDLLAELLASHCQGVRAKDDCGCGGRMPVRVARVQPAASGPASGSRPTGTLPKRAMSAGEFHDFKNTTQAGIWRGVATCAGAEKRLAESRQAWKRARQVREQSRTARALRFRGVGKRIIPERHAPEAVAAA